MSRKDALAERTRPSESVTTKPSGAFSTSLSSFQVIFGMTPTGAAEPSRDSRTRNSEVALLAEDKRRDQHFLGLVLQLGPHIVAPPGRLDDGEQPLQATAPMRRRTPPRAGGPRTDPTLSPNMSAAARVDLDHPLGRHVDDEHRFGRDAEQQPVTHLDVAQARVILLPSIAGLRRGGAGVPRKGLQAAAERDDAAAPARLHGRIEDRDAGLVGRYG